jgi:hypothetical protein
MENDAWGFLKSQLKNIDDIKYIGTLSQSAAEKINVHHLNEFLNTFEDDHDFVHFYSFPHKAVNHGNSNHPGFRKTWLELCKRIPESDPEIPNLACNFWMCKSDIFFSFLKWMTEVVLPASLTIQGMYLPTTYKEGKLSRKELEKKWGRPYYPLAPFILERFSYQFFKGKKNLLLDFSWNSIKKEKLKRKVFYFFGIVFFVYLLKSLFL